MSPLQFVQKEEPVCPKSSVSKKQYGVKVEPARPQVSHAGAWGLQVFLRFPASCRQELASKALWVPGSPLEVQRD